MSLTLLRSTWLSALALLAVTVAFVATSARTDEPDVAVAAFEGGVAERAMGMRLLDDAAADPEHAPAKQAQARKHFEQAAAAFAEAEKTFAGRLKPLDPQIKTLPADFERAACCRCALAETQLQLGQAKEASTTATPFLNDPLFRRSQYQRRALYSHGIASFQLGDLTAAGRSLNQLAPFKDSLQSLHARYLLAHVHRLQDELPEAVRHFEGVSTGFEALKSDKPAPEFVTRSWFCRGVLLYDLARFADAQAAFVEFLNRSQNAGHRSEAQLCLGMAQVHSGQYHEALDTLKPLMSTDKLRAPTALLWTARALLGSVKPDGSEEFNEALTQAQKALLRAAELLADDAKRDPAKRAQHSEVLLDLAGTQELGGQYADAVKALQQVADEAMLPGRQEEILRRRITALSLANRPGEARDLCREFAAKYPKSILAAEVTYRHGESAHFLALTASADAERKKLHDEAEKQLQSLVDRYPDYELVPWAQQVLAMAHYRRGDFEKCKTLLEKVPATDRHGALASVAYVLADCQMRTVPARADDALAAGQLSEQLHNAIDLLGGYVEEQPEPAYAADALLRLGLCKARLAAVAAPGEEHNRWREAARADFERLLVDYPLHPRQPQAALERSRCRNEDDPKRLIAFLRRYTQEPLSKTEVAPLAVLRLASVLRSQEGGAKDAIALLAKCRQESEKALLADPQRKRWAVVLQYQQAVALMEADKPTRARELLDDLLKRRSDDPLTAEAGLRREQCVIAEGWQAVAQADERLGAGNLKEDESVAVQKAKQAGLKMIRDAAASCEKRASTLEKNADSADIRATLLYQAAWTYRALAEPEINQAREKLGKNQVPLQPTEKKVRAAYQKLLADQPDHPLALEAALELAELHVDREDLAAAVELLKKALDHEPPAELADKLRLRLAMCLIAQKDEKGGLRQLEMVASRKDSPFMAQAHRLCGECLIAQQKWKEAIKHLAPFHDKEGFQGQGGVSDRALLLLGHAFSNSEKWEESRIAYTLVFANYGDSAWCNEARHRLAWAQYKQKNYRDAQHTLQDMKWDDPAELIPRARLFLAACYTERKKYGEAVGQLSELAEKATAGDVHAVALLEWAHVCRLNKKRDEAEKLFKRVVDKYPDTTWATVAKDRLKNDKDDAPAPHSLAAAEKLFEPGALPPAPLEPLGQMQPLTASTEDPTAELSLAFALSSKLPEQTTPAPIVRLGPTDPFEHRRDMKGRLPKEEASPLVEKIELPR